MRDEILQLLNKIEFALQERDGNLSGGYISLTVGAYRVAISKGNGDSQPPQVTNAADKCYNKGNCDGSKNEVQCWNKQCVGSTNADKNCWPL